MRLDPFETKVLSHVLGGTANAARCSLVLREIAVAPSGHLYPLVYRTKRRLRPGARLTQLRSSRVGGVAGS